MSIRVMAAVFELPDMGPTHRLIMLALADHADDAGRCYPSLDRLAKRTGLSLRAVRSNLRQLEADGQIRTDPQGGPMGCNLYFVTPQPRQEMPPAGDAPGISRRKPRQEMPPTPAGDAPEPSLNIKEPTETNVSVRRGRRLPSKPLPDDWVPDMAKAQSLMAELDLTRDEMNYCYQQMKGHAHATDRRLANWDQGFANWLRKAVKDGDVGPNSRSRRNSVNGSAFDF